jgi:hypothetical protein
MSLIEPKDELFEMAIAEADAQADIPYFPGDVCPYCKGDHRLKVEPGVDGYPEEPNLPPVLYCPNCGCDYAMNPIAPDELAKHIFNQARQSLGMPLLNAEELTEALSKPVCVFCAGTGKCSDPQFGDCFDCDGTGKPAGL